MIKLWNISTKRAYYLQGHSDNIIALAFSSDGEMMASASHDGKIWLWYVRQACDKPHVDEIEGKELEGSLAFSQFDAAGTICALSFTNSSCSIRAGVVNPQKQNSYSVSIYEVALYSEDENECPSSKHHA
jgi:WD40 repeat protein